MIPPPFEYVVPSSVVEAVHILDQDDNAKILAGGQSLIPMLRFRLAAPGMLVDINRIQGLDYIREEDGWLKIGAMTREAAIDRSDLVRKHYPLLADTARLIADPLVRNMATIGGNLSHADPANDHPATMLAYRAQVVMEGPQGRRTVPIQEFFEGPFESALQHNEILTEIRIPAHQLGGSGAYEKMERKVGDFATAAVAVQLQVDASGVCTSAGIALTNVGLTPIQATAAEHSLAGQALTDAAIRQAAQLAGEVAEPQDDHRGSEEYKRALVRTLTVRALRKAQSRLDGGQS
ncbi:MAG: xanthine dehydrogenase family protein subunit M [Anaerolineaceae bacterium]|nr:xanthine dehydrogenase family protein subunit M [Anaerolineaceae bacterium]